MNKKIEFLTAQQAVEKIKDNDHIACGGFVGAGVPEEVEKALEERFEKTGHPKNISVYFSGGQGDGKDGAINHLAKEGMMSFVIGGHIGLIPKLVPLINENKVKGYNLPLGVISHLFRASAGNKPGILTKVGLKTYVDPRVEGGKLNSATTEDWVTLTQVNGEDYLFYKRIDANVALLRGTTADEVGNITMEQECLFFENLAIAQMVKNNGGIVIVQVKNIVPAKTLNPQHVRIPGILVDVVVKVQDENDHKQTFKELYNPKYCSSQAMLKNDKVEAVSKQEFPLDLKKIIGRRCALEIESNKILNLGIGIPEYIAAVCKEEGVSDKFVLTVEPGVIGGNPAGGLSFGASEFPQAIIYQDQLFDFYDGGGLDQVFLGLAECDQKGDINVSRFGPKIAGCGGFINITQNAKKVYFCGTLTAGKDIDIQVVDGKLKIIKDGTINKFIKKVQQITFSGEQALLNKQSVHYVTERAVFKLTPEGLELIEIAPGVDLQKDVLDKMDFKPKVSSNLKLMDARIFKPELMNLKIK